MSSQTLLFRKYGTLLARIIIGGYFLKAGIDKITEGVDSTAGYIDSATGLPLPLLVAWLVVFIEIVFGAAIILGKKTSKSALVLAVFTLLTVLMIHGPGTWEANPMQEVMFMKNLVIMSGLLYLVAYGPGDGWRLGAKSTTSQM